MREFRLDLRLEDWTGFKSLGERGGYLGLENHLYQDSTFIEYVI